MLRWTFPTRGDPRGRVLSRPAEISAEVRPRPAVTRFGLVLPAAPGEEAAPPLPEPARGPARFPALEWAGGGAVRSAADFCRGPPAEAATARLAGLAPLSAAAVAEAAAALEGLGDPRGLGEAALLAAGLKVILTAGWPKLRDLRPGSPGFWLKIAIRGPNREPTRWANPARILFWASSSRGAGCCAGADCCGRCLARRWSRTSPRWPRALGRRATGLRGRGTSSLRRTRWPSRWRARGRRRSSRPRWRCRWRRPPRRWITAPRRRTRALRRRRRTRRRRTGWRSWPAWASSRRRPRALQVTGGDPALL